MKTNAQIYSDRLTALQGKGIGEHGTFWKLKAHQSGFADVSYQKAPDLTNKPGSAKKLLNPIEYAAQKQAYNMEKALASRDQIFAELAKPTPSMLRVMNHVNAIIKSGVPMDSISWKVAPPSSGSGTAAQGLLQDPMAMVGPAFSGAAGMLARLENGEKPQSDDNPAFKFRPSELTQVLEALKDELKKTLASNPPANTSSSSSANTSANAMGGTLPPTRNRGNGITAAHQPLPRSATVATGQPQPQSAQVRTQDAPTALGAQGAPDSLEVLTLREKVTDLEVSIQMHVVDPTKVSRAQADLAQKQVNALEARINRIKAEEAIKAAKSSTTTTTEATTTTTATTTMATPTTVTPTTGTNPFAPSSNPFFNAPFSAPFNPFTPANPTDQTPT